MNQTLVGLRFLLTHGHILGVGLPVNLAKEIIKKWNERWFHLNNHETITGACHLSNTDWTVELSDIRAIHTYQIAPQGPKAPGNGGNPFLGLSGVN